MLDAGLLDATTAQWHRLHELQEGAGHSLASFYGLVVSIASFAGITPEQRQRLLDGSILGGEGRYAPAFAAAVTRFIADGDVEPAELWERWLRDHLSGRLEGVPREATVEELEAWLDIVPYLGAALPDGLRLLERTRVGLGKGFRAPDFADDVLESHGRELLALFVDRVRLTTGADMFIGYQAKMLLGAFRRSLGDDAARPLEIALIDAGLCR